VKPRTGTNISGALTEVKSIDVREIESTSLMLKRIFNEVMFLSPFKFANKIGEKVTYYGVIQDSFGYVVGEAKKKKDGSVAI
jgi:hypothetical protein